MSSNISAEEMTGSLTGFDEKAIARAFGTSMGELFQGKEPTLMLRALVYVAKKRDGNDDAKAYQLSMEMPLKEVQEYFDETADDDGEPE